MPRRVMLGTNLAYSSQTLHGRGQRHGMFATNDSECDISNPLIARGLLKILRDSHSRPYPMVQGIEDNSSPTPRAEVKRTTADGLLKIPRDSHSRPYLMVQGIDDNSSPTPRAEVKRTTAEGSLKILRDSHSRPDPMVQGIGAKCLVNPIMSGVNRHDESGSNGDR